MSLMLAVAVLAFQPGELEVPEALGTAFETWSTCLEDRLEATEPKRNATRMADRALRECRGQQRTFTRAFDTWLPTAPVDDAQRQRLRSQFQQQVASVRAQTIEMAQAMVED